MKIVLIVLAVVVGLGALIAGGIGFMAWRVSKTFQVNGKGDGGTVTIPGGGTVSVGNSGASDAELGVPAYPGATREKGGMNMSSASASMVMAHLTTADSPSDVVDFYKGKMGDGMTSVATGSNDGTVLSSGGNPNDRIMVTVGKGSGTDAGKTTIIIMHTKKLK